MKSVQLPSAETSRLLHHEIDDATGEPKLKVNPRKILESLSHLRIDISRIKEVESGGDPKCGGQGTVVPSILLPEGAPDDTENFVAVKKLRSGEDQDWDRVLASFAYELQLLNGISHENIVKVIGFVENAETGVAWMLFNWEANGNMREVVATAKLEIPELMWLVDDVARGLAHLHNMNPPICHGDLKSLNILINSDFRAVITDFGSARAMTSENPDENKAQPLSVEQRTMEQPVIDKFIKIQVEADCITLAGQRGTVRWLAPEILEGSLPNLSTDVWAFGWICWEAVTGNFPFDNQGEPSAQDIEIILRIVEGRLPVLKENSEMRQIQELCNHIEHCWNRDPAKRPSAQRCEQILGLMSQVRPQRRNPEMAEEAYSSRLLRSLGRIRWNNDQMDDAMDYFARSLRIAKAAGNLADVGYVLAEIGEVHQSRSEYTKAEECYVQARDVFTQIGDQLGIAYTVKGLGDLHRFRGEYPKAEERYIQARDALSKLGNQLGMANTVKSLGDVHKLRDEYAKAEECYVQARDAFTQLGDHLGTANAVKSLGDVHRFRNEYTKAEEYYVQARDVYAQVGNTQGTANVMRSLGDLHLFRGEHTKAEECYVQARDAYAQLGDQLGMANTFDSLGNLHRVRGEFTKAEECYVQARDVYAQFSDQLGITNVAKSLGDIHRFRGEYTKAEECYVQARDAYAEINDELGIANALIGLGRVYQMRKEYDKAKESYIATRDIASRIEYSWALDVSMKGLKDIDLLQNEPIS